MRRRLARAAPYALLLVLAGALYGIASRIEYVGPAENIGPDFWPRAILILLAAVCAYELAKSFLSGSARSAGGMLQALVETAPDSRLGAQQAKPGRARLVLGIAATLGYVVLVDVLGFFLATAGFIAAFIAIGGYRRWTVLAACAVGGSLAMVLVFMKLVYVSLPLGAGPFRAVSLGLLAALGVR